MGVSSYRKGWQNREVERRNLYEQVPFLMRKIVLEGKIMKKYISYEEGSKGTFTEREMKNIYVKVVDKEEYADHDIWIDDMLRSGVFVQVQ